MSGLLPLNDKKYYEAHTHGSVPLYSHDAYLKNMKKKTWRNLGLEPYNELKLWFQELKKPNEP